MTVEDVLMHHGILGQKWGTKHGPPYPLDEKKSRWIRRKGKEEKKSKTPKASDIKKNIDDYSDEELRQILNRINMESQIGQLASKEKTSAQEMADKILKAGKTASEFYNLYNSPMGKAIQDYLKKNSKK